MLKFNDWLAKNHPETIEEGWMQNLALGGAMLGAGMGIGCSRENPEACKPDKIQSMSVTSPDAADYFSKSSSQEFAMSDPSKMSDSDFQSWDQARRGVAMANGNADPGAMSRDDYAKRKAVNDKFKKAEERKKRIFNRR